MYNASALRLLNLATLLVAVTSLTNTFIKVPSKYKSGTKWILVREDKASVPSTTIAQSIENVESINQHLQYLPQSQVPVQVPIAPAHVASSFPGYQHIHNQMHFSIPQQVQADHQPEGQFQVLTSKPGRNEYGLLGDFDTEIIESKPGSPPHYQPQYEHDHSGDYHPNKYGDDGKYHPKSHQVHYDEKPRVKITTYGLTAVPISAVHVKAPTVIEYFRKKKSV